MADSIAVPTADDVRVVVKTALTDIQIDSVIQDAKLLARRCIESLDSETQTAILKWLTAHLISAIKSKGGGTLTSDALGDASQSYSTVNLGKQLGSSAYGQNALLLDPNGCLARIGKARASIEKV